MEKMLGYCGIDCRSCDVYIATVNNDDALRERTAKLWSELNHVTITPEMLNCTGCRADGPKTYYCSDMCGIHKCAEGRGYENCGECPVMDGCPTVAVIHKDNKQAKENLTEKNLK